MPPAVQGRVGNLPFELSSFVGRRREVTEAKRLLSATRLVTLTGIGGVGKTRLALRVAADVARAFGDGVWLVELGELQDSELLPDAVISALGLCEQAAHPPLTLLTEYLAQRRLLLVLDNCEHLVNAAAALAETLLKACADLRILATSREPLGIGGEAALRVPPLSAPDPDRVPSAQGLSSFDAVTLFTERAAAAVSGFDLTDDNSGAVAGICSRLDGLPLPIELAAARLRAMSTEQILRRLTGRFQLLTVGSRGAPTRQQTLRLCVDWSYELCTVRERALWGRLAVFAGGFELDAAEGICAGELSAEELLDLVASLVDKSILIREEPGDVVRYRLLETLREYGAERCRESGAYEILRRRHRDWYEELALRAEAEWIGPQQLQWIARLEREQTNLRDAMEFCISAPEGKKVGLPLVTALHPFWRACGRFSEGRRWLERVLALQADQPTVAHVRALCAASGLAAAQGDISAAGALTQRGQALADQSGDTEMNALATAAAGRLALRSGDLGRAITCFDTALGQFGTNKVTLQRIWSLLGLGLACGLLGDTARAIRCYEEVLALTEPVGESVYRGWSLWALGSALWQQNDRARAAELIEQGLRLTRSADDPLGCAWCLQTLAWMAAEENRAQRAAVLLGAAESLRRSVGSPKVVFSDLSVHQAECERNTRSTLGGRAFDAAFRRGSGLSAGDAVSYALDERRPAVSSHVDAAISLTHRERQVADLVAQGLTNRAIAEKLVISQRTAQGHVEHVLAKLGFTSRVQIAAWVVDQTHDSQP
ncbi:ATP-binding protein [Rhodococcus sp. NPDC059968]|uniref:ATP-binding protein n=1 Tax=Rhodococcus sp. NPDC059968 TaxID=3347017 RepID=UPI0036712E6E